MLGVRGGDIEMKVLYSLKLELQEDFLKFRIQAIHSKKRTALLIRTSSHDSGCISSWYYV